MPTLADLAAIRLPRLAEPVLVAGSVTALVVTATFGMSSMEDGGASNATLAADRGDEGAASRSNPVGEEPPAEKVDVAREGEVHIPELAAANPEPAKPEPAQPKAKAEPKKTEAPKATPKAAAPKKDAGPVGDDVWKKLANCEAGGRNDLGAPYYGYFQFSPKTWASVGGTGLPSDHSYEEQKAKAQELQKRSGWGQWPACSSKLGLNSSVKA